MTTEEKINGFFAGNNRVPFSELPTTMICGNAYWDARTSLNPEVIFRNIPVYEIDGYVRGKKKQIKLVHPGVPYAILSVKYNREVRGIVKDLNVLAEPVGKKKKFMNQVSVDLCLSDKIVNIMVFFNTMKIAGAKTKKDLADAYTVMKSYLDMMYRQGYPVYNESPILKEIKMNNENIGFNLGFEVRKDVLRELALRSGHKSPSERDAVKVLFEMGSNKANGEERFYTFRILHTGYVTYSGDDRDNMNEMYEKFWNFIEQYQQYIRL